MGILGRLESQHIEELEMSGHRGDPFVAAHHMGGAHQAVVHGVGKVIGGDAVCFQKHDIGDVFVHLPALMFSSTCSMVRSRQRA